MILNSKACASCNTPQAKEGWKTRRKGILVKPGKLQKMPVQNMAPGGSKAKSE